MSDIIEAPSTFRDFLGNARVVEIVRRALTLDKLPHAMIFAGPEGIGKRTFALLLAQALNCFSSEGDSCGACRSCKKIAAASHPDVRLVLPDGANIKIDQIRALSAEIAYQPFEGKFRISILDAADRMTPEASNSLLKTLEEPPSRTFIILVTPNPHALLATIRSRCRLLLFGGLTRQQVEYFLQTRAGRSPLEAKLAASASEGSLSAALRFDTGEFKEARGRALEFLRLVLGDGSFAEASRLASTIAKEKEEFLSWMGATFGLLEELYFSQVFPARLGEQGAPEDVESLARSVPHSRVVSGIDAIRQLRSAQRFNANRQIALESVWLKVRENP